MHRLAPSPFCFVWLAAVAGGLGAGGLQAAEAWREAGRPLLQQFGARDFAAYHQMFVGMEDRDGLLFFGNRGCVLAYDGTEWTRIPIGQTTFVRGLAQAPDGTIYVGAVDEIGYLQARPTGGWQFVSLREQVPAAHRSFGDIWQAVASADGVFFGAGRKLFRWDQGTFRVWELPGDKSVWLHLANGRVYYHRAGEPLMRWESGEFREFSSDPFIMGSRLRFVLGGGGAELLLGTAESGLATLDETTGRLTLRPTEADDWMRRMQLQSMARAGALILLGSNRGGMVAIDGAGRFVRRFDESDGLRDPSVRHLLPTRDGAVWLALNNGVARVALPFEQTRFGREHGLDGSTARALAWFEDKVHVATGRGVFRLEPATAAGLVNARFEPLPGTPRSFHSLLGTPQGLLAGEVDGIYHWQSGAQEPRLVTRSPTVVMLAASRTRPGRVWAGTTGGVLVVDADATGGWRVSPAPDALRFEARSAAEAKDGSLWLGTFTRGVARVRWPAGDAQLPEVAFFAESHGLPRGQRNIRVFGVGGEVFMRCGSGETFRYDAARESLVPAASAIGAGTPQVWIMQAGSDSQPEKLLGFSAAGKVAERAAPGFFSVLGSVQAVETDPKSGALWLAGADGVGRIDVGLPNASAPKPGVALGAAEVSGQAEWPEGNALPAGAHTVVLRYRTAGFAAHPQFSTRLEGLEDEWTPWSAERHREFARPPPGRYALHGRARDAAGESEAKVLFSFSIAPPWWQAWWALGLWTAGGVGAIAGLFRWRLRQLRLRAAALEATVAARTKELAATVEQLVITRDAAEAANRAKSTFLAHMSHELRTPLNGILGYAQVLARDPAQPPPARERLGVIVSSGEHLLALINDVLDLARVESGKLRLRPVDFTVGRLAMSVAEVVRGRCDEKGLAFAVNLEPGLPRSVRGDEQKLRQVLLNLLGNSVKFTTQGTVSLTVSPAPDGRVRFVVEDTGRGIPAGRLPLLFQPFETTEEKGAGTGLGLALSQNMVELLGGSIHVSSEPGRGSRFWFDLPLPEVANGSPEAAGAAARPVIGIAGPAPRVLVVDDHAVNRAVLRELLAPLGCRVTEATDGSAALAAARAEVPDVVLLDLRFDTGLGGLAIARMLRAEPGLARLKIVAVSASVFESDRHQALAAGCDDFLGKPFKDEQLFALLGSLLGIEWVRAEAVVSPAPTGVPVPLAAETRSELLEFARRGDARRLRARLAELASDPRHAAQVAALDALAASFQMARLRELLSSDVKNHPDHR